jgi:hypothetical protein
MDDDNETERDICSIMPSLLIVYLKSSGLNFFDYFTELGWILLKFERKTI